MSNLGEIIHNKIKENEEAKRDAALLRKVASELFYWRDREKMMTLADAREAGTWVPELEV